jgi:hypothetical protein
MSETASIDYQPQGNKVRSLTRAEKKVVRLLQELESCWPDSLFLQAGTGGLTLMQNGTDGMPIMRKTVPIGGVNETLDQEGIVRSFEIPADGGDPW